MKIEPVLIPYEAGHFSFLKQEVDSPELLQRCAGTTFNYPLDETKYTEFLSESSVFPFVLVLGQSIVAYGDLLKDGNKEVRLCRLLTGKLYRGKGFGQKLVEGLTARAKSKFPKLPVRLFVIEDNIPAYHCYLKSGFQPNGFESVLPESEIRVIQMEYYGD